jgi:type 1 fimbria pilin
MNHLTHSLTPHSHAFADGDATDANKQTVLISGAPVCPSIRKGKAITARLESCDAKADGTSAVTVGLSRTSVTVQPPAVAVLRVC